MSNFDILDEGINAQLEANQKLRARLRPWIWAALGCFLVFLATPSLIMLIYSPSDVNEVSPIDAHVLVISMFVISGIGLLVLIGLLVWRWRLGRKY